MDDIYFMKKALKQAKVCEKYGEVPVGAVIVKNGKVIARGHNMRESAQMATAHAEHIAIDRACKKLRSWRLTGCTLYVTLEPCIMCAGAIVNSRIDRVVIGTPDKKAGAMGGIVDVLSLPVNHKPEVTFGVLQDECREILKNFFARLRKGPVFNKNLKV